MPKDFDIYGYSLIGQQCISELLIDTQRRWASRWHQSACDRSFVNVFVFVNPHIVIFLLLAHHASPYPFPQALLMCHGQNHYDRKMPDSSPEQASCSTLMTLLPPELPCFSDDPCVYNAAGDQETVISNAVISQTKT